MANEGKVKGFKNPETLCKKCRCRTFCWRCMSSYRRLADTRRLASTELQNHNNYQNDKKKKSIKSDGKAIKTKWVRATEEERQVSQKSRECGISQVNIFRERANIAQHVFEREIEA